jgi:hypothetical protein
VVVGGRVEQVTRPDGQNQLCITADKVAWGPERSMPGKTCTDIAMIVGMGTPGSGGLKVGAYNWTALASDGSILAIAQDPCADTVRCAQPPEQTLVDNLRCGRLSRLWSGLPVDDVRCAEDADCTLLSSMCFDHAVRADRSAPYEAIVKRWGGVCLDPAAGACPHLITKAMCHAGRCETGR